MKLTKIAALLLGFTFTLGAYANPQVPVQDHKIAEQVDGEFEKWNIHVSEGYATVFATSLVFELFLSSVFSSGIAEILFRSGVIYPAFYWLVTHPTFLELRDTLGGVFGSVYEGGIGPNVDFAVNRGLDTLSSTWRTMGKKLKSYSQ